MSFGEFWANYPRKVARFVAEKAWNKLSTSEQQEALQALPNHIAYWKACETEKQFIPHAATFLNQHRWEDELEMPKPKQKAPEVAWWGSEQLILAKGQEVGLMPRPGESIWEFKGRIVDKLRVAA